MTIPTIELNNGVTIPQLGFGTFRVDEGSTQQTVETALEAGYRHIDTAAGYYNEQGVGAAIRASGLPREEVFVTTKLRNGEQGYDSALTAYRNSRDALGLDHIDLYLIHWPVPSLGRYKETWKALEKLYADQEVRAIGVSNFLPAHLLDLLDDVEVTPAVNQIELHPSFQQPTTQAASEQAGIAIEAYAPLGQAEDLQLPPITEAAEAHGVSPAQVVLRWHLQNGVIAIPKSVTPERIRSNIDVLGFELSEQEMSAITHLDTPERQFPDPQTADFTQMKD